MFECAEQVPVPALVPLGGDEFHVQMFFNNTSTLGMGCHEWS